MDQASQEKTYLCLLKPHRGGRFFISGRPYRPEWPNGVPSVPSRPEEIAFLREMIFVGVQEGERYARVTGLQPQYIHLETISPEGACFVHAE